MDLGVAVTRGVAFAFGFAAGVGVALGPADFGVLRREGLAASIGSESVGADSGVGVLPRSVAFSAAAGAARANGGGGPVTSVEEAMTPADAAIPSSSGRSRSQRRLIGRPLASGASPERVPRR